MAAARTRSRFDREDARPRSDVYTGLLAISLIAMIASCVLLYLDYAQYGSMKAPAVQAAPPAQPKNLSQGALPPPPPIEERPFTMAPAPIAPTFVQQPEPTPPPMPIIPVAAVEPPAPSPTVISAAAEAPSPTAEAPPCTACPKGPCGTCPKGECTTTPPATPPPAEAPAAPKAADPPHAPAPAAPKAGDPPPLPKSVRNAPPA